MDLLFQMIGATLGYLFRYGSVLPRKYIVLALLGILFVCSLAILFSGLATYWAPHVTVNGAKSEWLFDAGRAYLDQLALYKAHKERELWSLPSAARCDLSKAYIESTWKRKPPDLAGGFFVLVGKRSFAVPWAQHKRFAHGQNCERTARLGSIGA